MRQHLTIQDFCHLFQILPDMTSIVAKWQSLSKKDMTGGEEKKTKTEGGAEQRDNKSEVPGNNIYSTCILFSLISPVKQRGKSKQYQFSVSCTLFWTVPDTTEIILLKALILQVICLYQKVVPHLVSQCKFDFSKLLKGNVPSVE